MKKLTHKDLTKIEDCNKHYTVVLEPVNRELKSFKLHIKKAGRGSGVLYGARGKVRTWKNLTLALGFIKDMLDVDEVVILLKSTQETTTEPL